MSDMLIRIANETQVIKAGLITPWLYYGKDAYLHIRYAPNGEPTDDQISTTPNDYIGLCANHEEAAPTTASSYVWARINSDSVQTAVEAFKIAAEASATAAAASETTAAQKATEATQSASAAEVFETIATQKAVDAGQSASAAAASETIATQKAVDAGQSASAAAASETIAKQKAEDARQSASAAEQSAVQAAGSAGIAGAKATEAGQSATAANTAETAAQAAKTAAESARDTAATKATEAGQSATAANTAETAAEAAKGVAATKANEAKASAELAASYAEAAGSAHPPVAIMSDSASVQSPEAGGVFTAVDSVVRNSLGHVEKINVKTVTLPAAVTSVSGNAGTAAKLQTARRITLEGDVTGSALFDGSTDIQISTTDAQCVALSANAAGTRYYPLADLPVDDGNSHCSVTIDGRFGGWTNANIANYKVLLTNRSSQKEGNVVTSAAECLGKVDAAMTIADIVVYRQADKSGKVYLKATGFFAVDFRMSLLQATKAWDGTYTADPSGTQIWALSAAKKLIVDDDGTVSADAFSGNAATATKAAQDGVGQPINATYLKNVAVSGRTITATRGDGTTMTATTQDTVYTHPSGDGNLHVPATGTDSGGKVLVAGATIGSAAWAKLGMSDVTELDAALNAKAPKPIIKTGALTVAGWTGSAAPYTQVLSVAGVTASNLISVGPSSTLTKAQYEAYGSAGVFATAQGAGTLTFSAFGDKPTVELPVMITVWG